MGTVGLAEIEASLYDFLAGLDAEQLSADVTREARMRVLDQIGASIRGMREPATTMALEYAASRDTGVEATVFGSTRRLGTERAAFVNGVSGHVLELDDGNRYAMGHPGVAVIPAVLALAEELGSSYSQALLAIVAGYEVFERVGKAINPSHRLKGYHTTGTVGSLAAAAAVAKLLSFDACQMANTVGLAASLSGGLFEFLENGSMSKQMHAGSAAQNGIRAGLLTQVGFTGPHTALLGKDGFFGAYSDRSDPEGLVKELGEHYAICRTYTKLHACCRHIHPSVDALLLLMNRHGFGKDEVQEIRVHTYSHAADLRRTDIETSLAAKLSLPYCIGAAVVHGTCGVAVFEGDAIHDRRILDIMRCTAVSVDLDIDKQVPQFRGSRVEVLLKQGDTVSEQVMLAKGEPENPVSRSDLIDKFCDLTHKTWHVHEARTIATSILDAEDESPATSVLSRLRIGD